MDVQHSPPKGWKAFQANYDVVFAQSDRLCTVCLSQQQIQALLSQTEYLYWPSRWVKAEGDVDSDVVTQFTEDLERQLLMACCDDQLPIQWRYTTDGVLQQSTNGGGTWLDAPLYDPRVYSTQFPPVPGAPSSDKKCIAATGASLLVKEQVGDQLTDDMSRYTLGQLITDWVKTMIDSSNPFLALVTVVTNQVFALVIALLRPALTDTVYHMLTCAFYCNMASDISFNLAQWQQVRTDITDTIGGIAGIFLEHLVFLLGTQGITNLCRSGAATTGDCSDCGCTPDCLIGDWQAALWYSGTYYPPGSSSVKGIEIARDSTSITIQSQDRGDGQQVMSLTTANGLIFCTFSAEFVGAAPDHTLHFFNLSPNHAEYLTQTGDETAPFTHPFSMCYLQMDPGSWVVKFTIAP